MAFDIENDVNDILVPEIAPMGIGANEARLNVTWQGGNGDLVDPVPFDATDAQILRWAEEAVRAGIPGIRPDANVRLQDFVVDRFAATADVPYNRLAIRPKTPFGV